jgi:hypothetical protein
MDPAKANSFQRNFLGTAAGQYWYGRTGSYGFGSRKEKVPANIQPAPRSSRSPYWDDVEDDLAEMLYTQAVVAAASGQILTDGACGNLCNGAILIFGGLAGNVVASNWRENKAAHNCGENGTPRYIYNQTVTVVEAIPTEVGQTVAYGHLAWDVGNAVWDEVWSGL